MKVRALGRLSGAVGERQPGAEFELPASRAKPLIARGVVVEVPASEPAADPAGTSAPKRSSRAKG